MNVCEANRYYSGKVRTFRVKDGENIFSIIKFPDRWWCECLKKNCKHIKEIKELIK